MAPKILIMDVAGLQEALKEGKFTSFDLVNLYGSRCRDYAVDYCLATEENFLEAIRLAK